MKAFTLIELLIVVSIIGILSGIIFFTISGGRDEANKNVGKFNNSQFINLLEQTKSLYPNNPSALSKEVKKLIGDFSLRGDRTKQALTLHSILAVLGSSFNGCNSRDDFATFFPSLGGDRFESWTGTNARYFSHNLNNFQCHTGKNTIAFRVTDNGDIWYCGRFAKNPYNGNFYAVTIRSYNQSIYFDCRVGGLLSTKCSSSSAPAACDPFK